MALEGHHFACLGALTEMSLDSQASPLLLFPSTPALESQPAAVSTAHTQIHYIRRFN